MSCPPCTPCSESCDPAHEPLPSSIDNFVTHFFGEVTKTCVDGKVVWALPCDLDTGVPGFPRAEGEGLACYLKRMFVDLFANYGNFGTMALQNANAVNITGGSISGLTNPVSPSQAATKSYVDGVVSSSGPVFNVRAYGATGDGATDDTAAINSAFAALNLLAANGHRGALYFPRGVYAVNSALTFSVGSGDPTYFNKGGFTLRGDGPGVSTLKFTATATGVTISVPSPQQQGIDNYEPITVEDIAITTSVVNSGTALTISGAVSDQAGRHAIVRNVIVSTWGLEKTGPVVAQQWANGIVIRNCSNASVIDTNLVGVLENSGSATNGSNIGIFYEVTPGYSAALFKVSNCQLYAWHKGIAAGGAGASLEGVYLTDTDCINCNYGVYWDSTNVEEDLKISGGHMACFLGNVYVNKCYRAFINDMNFHLQDGGTYTSRYGVYLNYATHTVVHDNFFRAAASTGDTQRGVEVYNSEFVKIHDNTFERFNTDILYSASASNSYNHHNLSLTGAGVSRAPVVVNNGTNNSQDEGTGPGSFGTMALQNANAVNITGGSITGLSLPTVATGAATKGYVDGLIPSIGSPTVFDVRNYGALGDGTADDTAAINSAVTAALVPVSDPTEGAGATRIFATVHFPRGTYKISGPINITAPVNSDYVHLKLTGEGPGISVVTQITASANGFVVNLASSVPALTPRRTVEFHDLSVKAKAVCGQAIQVAYSASTSFHQRPGCRFVNVAIVSESPTEYWANGLLLNHAWNAVVDRCVFSGNPGTLTGRGIDLTGLCVNFSATNSQFNFWDIGFAYINNSVLTNDQNTEGILLNQIYMVPVNSGVHIKGNPNANYAGDGLDWNSRYVTGRMALFSLVSSHFDARGGAGTAAVRLENVTSFMLTGNNLIASTGAANVVYLNQAYEGTATGNTFFGPVGVAVDVTGKSTNNTFVGNQFRQGGDGTSPIAFRFGTTTQYNIASNNTRENIWPLLNEDNCTQNGGQSNNLVGQPLNLSATVTTTGGTPTQTFSVNISKAALGRKCDAIAVSLNTVATNIGAQYDWLDALNTKSVARIQVYTLNGANLPAATTYRLGLAITPGTY